MEGETIRDARLVCGAAACVPWRLEAAESAIIGKTRNDDDIERAAVAAVEGAQPLNFNGFKIPLLSNLVRRAIKGAGGAST